MELSSPQKRERAARNDIWVACARRPWPRWGVIWGHAGFLLGARHEPGAPIGRPQGGHPVPDAAKAGLGICLHPPASHTRRLPPCQRSFSVSIRWGRPPQGAGPGQGLCRNLMRARPQEAGPFDALDCYAMAMAALALRDAAWRGMSGPPP